MSQLDVESVKAMAAGLWTKFDEFSYELDVTPLAHTTTPLWVVPTYLAMVYGTRYYVRNIRKKPFDLNPFVIVHNWALALGSGVLLALLAYDLFLDVQKYGMFDVYCDPGYKHNNGRRFLFYYINYIFKYVELIDTLLLALRDKPLIFLHVYHHAATLVLCWSQMNARSCVQWIPITVNLFIHVIMYSYYALHAMGKDVWWKKYLTTAQIIQFVVVLCLITPPLAFKILHDSVGVEIVPDCNGSYGWSFFGVGIIASYLLLFLDLYSVKYTKPGGKKDKSGKATAEKENGSKSGDVPLQGMSQSNVARRTGTKANQ